MEASREIDASGSLQETIKEDPVSPTHFRGAEGPELLMQPPLVPVLCLLRVYNVVKIVVLSFKLSMTLTNRFLASVLPLQQFPCKSNIYI